MLLIFSLYLKKRKKSMHKCVFVDGSSNIQKYFGVHAWNSTF